MRETSLQFFTIYCHIAANLLIERCLLLLSHASIKKNEFLNYFEIPGLSGHLVVQSVLVAGVVLLLLLLVASSVSRPCVPG